MDQDLSVGVYSDNSFRVRRRYIVVDDNPTINYEVKDLLVVLAGQKIYRKKIRLCGITPTEFENEMCYVAACSGDWWQLVPRRNGWLILPTPPTKSA